MLRRAIVRSKEGDILLLMPFRREHKFSLSHRCLRMVVIGGGWSIGSCLHEVKGCVSRYSRRNRPTNVDRAAGIAARSGTRLVSSPFVLRGLFGFWTRVVFGGILIAGGLILASLGIRNFRQAATNVEPWKPSVTLVTTGIYGLMRNP